MYELQRVGRVLALVFSQLCYSYIPYVNCLLWSTIYQFTLIDAVARVHRTHAMNNFYLYPQVILGKHSILKAEVALKVLEINKVEDSYVKKNFEREAALMLHLNHPNVVSLHEVMKTKGYYCLVMDCLRGGTLCDLVQNQKVNSAQALA